MANFQDGQHAVIKRICFLREPELADFITVNAIRIIVTTWRIFICMQTRHGAPGRCGCAAWMWWTGGFTAGWREIQIAPAASPALIPPTLCALQPREPSAMDF